MSKLNIHNIRLGFACNSSSTHSLVLVGTPVKDKYVTTGEFGWDRFIAASKRAKLLYTAITLKENLRSVGYPPEISDLIARQWSGLKEMPSDSYIDHQSIITIPVEVKSPFDCYEALNRSYFDDLKDYILRDDLVIVGGNDNEYEDLEIVDGNRSCIPLPVDDRCGRFIARKDHDTWVLFNRETGGKLRFSFKDETPYTHSTYPELVDIKITDFCELGCEYCYADSTAKGSHADMSYLFNLAHALSDMGVFEVALGGGEPTTHPKFDSIVELFHNNKICVNVTTHGSYGIRNAKTAKRLSSIAHSVSYDLSVLDKRDKYRDMKLSRSPCLYVNVVMGTIDRDDFRRIIYACQLLSITPVLLGFKKVGRGANFNLIPYDWWVDDIKESQAMVHIDTCLACEYKDRLVEEHIPSILYTTEEGKYSMYIDAVNGLCGPSSYETDKLVRLDLGSKDLKNSIAQTFATF